MAKLSEGAIMTLALGGQYDEPVLQVLGLKGVVGSENRYRLLLSDGKHSISFAMLATHLTPMITKNELDQYAIIKVVNHVISSIPAKASSFKRVLVVMGIEVLKKGSEIGKPMGSPIPVNDMGVPQTPTPGHCSSIASTNSAPSPQRNNKSYVNDTVLNSPTLTSRTHPINSLSPYQNNWVIKARVTSKSPIRTWSNAKGEGKLFSVELADSSSEIRATGFRDDVDTFYNILQEGKIYLISKCQVKMANKKFSSSNNDYELTFTSESKIVPCEDEDVSIPSLHFNFKRLNNVQEAEVQSLIDIIGVCQSFGEVNTFTSRTTQRELKKRDVTLVDQTMIAVSLTLWGDQAEEFDGSTQPIIAIKGARVGEFMGAKSLGLIGSSAMQLNPDIPEAHQLRSWFDNLTEDVKFNSISTRTEGGGSDSQFLTIHEALKDKLGTGDKADYFNVFATLMNVRSDKTVYKACPAEDCNKKVIDQNTGQYMCEKCNREYDSFKYRLMLFSNISDSTGHAWITLFQDQAEKLLGKTSDEVGKLQLEDSPRYEQVLNRVAFEDYQFRVRAKTETYNDEQKLKLTAFAVNPVDRVKRCKFLISEIRKMAGIEHN